MTAELRHRAAPPLPFPTSRVRTITPPPRTFCAHDDDGYRALMLRQELHRTRWERRAVFLAVLFLGIVYGVVAAYAIALSSRPPGG